MRIAAIKYLGEMYKYKLVKTGKKDCFCLIFDRSDISGVICADIEGRKREFYKHGKC